MPLSLVTQALPTNSGVPPPTTVEPLPTALLLLPPKTVEKSPNALLKLPIAVAPCEMDTRLL